MKNITLIAVITLVGIQVSFGQLLPNFGGERAGLSALSFLKYDMNPRSIGMAGTSLANSVDGFSVISNPAALTELEYKTYGLSHSFLGGGLQQSLAALYFPLKNASTLGISINGFNSGEMEERTEFQPGGTGRTFYVGNYAFGLTYARALSAQFSAAITLKYVYEGVAEYSNSTATADIGFLYTTDIKRLKFAVMIQNFGGNSGLDGDMDEIPVLFNRDTEITLSDNVVPTVFKMGASFVPYETKHQSLTAAIQLNHPNDNAENYRIGFEYEYVKTLYVRSGLRFNVEGQSLVTFGFSVKSRLGGHPFYFDYAANPTSSLGIQNTVGLRIQIIKDSRE